MRSFHQMRIGAGGPIPSAPTDLDVGSWIAWWQAYHPGASTDYVDLIRRDLNGVLFLWDTKLEGTPPDNAPIDRRLSDDGGRIPANAISLTPTSRPQDSSPLPPPTPAPTPPIRFSRPSSLGTEIKRVFQRGLIHVTPGGGAVSTVNPNASSNSTLGTVLTLAALTAPAWGTLLWLKFYDR